MSDERQDYQSGQESSSQERPLRRRPRRRKFVYRRSHWRTWLLVSLLLALPALAGLYYLQQMTQRNSFAVVLNGESLAVVANEDDAVQAIRAVKARRAPSAPEIVEFVEGTPAVARVSAQRTVTPEQAVNALDARLSTIIDGAAIFVKRQPLVMLKSRDEAIRALSLMLDRGLGDRDGIPTFKQQVAVKRLRLDETSKLLVPLMTPEDAAAFLVHPPQTQVHTVQLGDNFWKIATAHDMTVDQLKALNPTVNYRALHAGDQIVLPDEPSAVTVVVVNAGGQPARRRAP